MIINHVQLNLNNKNDNDRYINWTHWRSIEAKNNPIIKLYNQCQSEMIINNNIKWHIYCT